MELLISLLFCFVCSFALAKPLRAIPSLFYGLALAADIVFLSRMLFSLAPDVAVSSFPYLARGLVGFSLLTVVMFVGALPDGSRYRRVVMPVRGELSLVACILIAGHVANYLASYLAQILGGFSGMSTAMIASFAVSSLLLILLVVLGVTSMESVKKAMSPSAWKTTQRWAYVFFALTYAHLALVLAPLVSHEGQRAFVSLAIYTSLFLLYAFARVGKAIRARADANQEANTMLGDVSEDCLVAE